MPHTMPVVQKFLEEKGSVVIALTPRGKIHYTRYYFLNGHLGDTKIGEPEDFQADLAEMMNRDTPAEPDCLASL